MDMRSVVSSPKTVAIVGLSPDPDRPSNAVGQYLSEHGFTVIPVNPTVSHVWGSISYPSVTAIPGDISVDVVDIFRRPDQVIAVIDDVVASGRTPVIWMQEGVSSPESCSYAEAHGFTVIGDACMMKVHRALRSSG